MLKAVNYYVILLHKIFQWYPIILRIKSKHLTTASKVLYLLHPPLRPHLISLFYYLCSTYQPSYSCSGSTSKLTYALEPFYQLLPLPEGPSSNFHMAGFLLSFKTQHRPQPPGLPAVPVDLHSTAPAACSLFVSWRLVCRVRLFVKIKHVNKNQKKKTQHRDFPGGTVVKNPPANAGNTGSSPGLGRFHMPRSN